jgi:rRNA biogenesis protein RRP5
VGAFSRTQAGTRLKVRILEADASRRRVTVTAKKTLLNSKLPIVATVGTAPGTVTHGYVTGLEHYGVFVSFYGGRKGLARLADLGLAQDQTPNDAFALHQVVKAKVLGADPNKGGRLRLSLDAGAVGASTADVAADAAAFELGDVVMGRVAAAVTTAADGPLDVLIQREDGSGAEVRALLDATHLSDHPAAAAVLRAALAPGTSLGRLVVLERRDAAGGGAGWRVSRKASLVASGSGAYIPIRKW